MSHNTQRLSGLDGLRALAVVAVIVFHANHHWMPGGYLGVEVFFVLSGFLITFLLIREHQKHDRIDLKSFADRRLRRLVPALLAATVFVIVYQVVTRHIALGQTRSDLLGALTYTANLTQIWQGQGYGAAQAFAPFRHFWSLAIEGQFYLLWPLAMVPILRWCGVVKKRYLTVAVVAGGVALLIAVSTAALFSPGPVGSQEACADGQSAAGYVRLMGRCVSLNDALYLGTFPRIGGLILGAAAAFALAASTNSHQMPGRATIGWVSLAGIGGMFATMWLQRDGETFIGIEFNAFLFRGGLFLCGVLTVGLVLAALDGDSRLSKLLENKVLTWIGTRSYGIYLYHWPIYQIIRQQAGSALTLSEFAIAAALTCGIAEVSYRFLETPVRVNGWRILRRHESDSKAVQASKRLVPFAAGGCCVALASQVASAPNDCATTTECAVLASQQEAAELDTIAVQDPGLEVGTDGSSEPPNSGSAGSESRGAKTPRAEAVAAVSGQAAQGNTRPSRPSETRVPSTDGVASVDGENLDASAFDAREQDTDAAPGDDPPPPITGTPHAVGESVMEEAAPFMRKSGIVTTAGVSWNQQKMFPIVRNWVSQGKIGSVLVIQVGTNSLVTDKTFDRFVDMVPPTTTIYLLTVRDPHKVIPKNNKVIRNQPNRHPNVRVIDWHKESFKTKMCRDGTHISCGGGSTKFYANMVNKAIGLPPVPEKPKATAKPAAP